MGCGIWCEKCDTPDCLAWAMLLCRLLLLGDIGCYAVL